MPIPSPFHQRTSAICTSHAWHDWAGYLSAAHYQPSHEHEYFAIRNSAALIDVSPFFKYRIRGQDALRHVNRIITRDIRRTQVGQILYSSWCDDQGKVVDDGTIWRLDETMIRITTADPNLRWFEDCGWGLQSEVEDQSTQLAALALQGPSSRRILQACLDNTAIDDLAYYWWKRVELFGGDILISRTGFTGDLGYELWFPPERALDIWDGLIEIGTSYGIAPTGLVALDMARIEAGLPLIEVDFISSRYAMTEAQKSSPFELGLGWTVNFDKGPYIGRDALARERKRGSLWHFVGIEVHWKELERLYGEADLPPLVVGRSSRESLPVFHGRRQVGRVTSSVFSPLLKKYIGLATLRREAAPIGSELDLEIPVEHSRRRARAKVVKKAFLDLRRKKDLA
jgi:aminomethyltransferase